MTVPQDTYPDRCVCCGRPVPEGRMVCVSCENGEFRLTRERSDQQPEQKETETKKEE